MSDRDIILGILKYMRKFLGMLEKKGKKIVVDNWKNGDRYYVVL